MTPKIHLVFPGSKRVGESEHGYTFDLTPNFTMPMLGILGLVSASCALTSLQRFKQNLWIVVAVAFALMVVTIAVMIRKWLGRKVVISNEHVEIQKKGSPTVRFSKSQIAQIRLHHAPLYAGEMELLDKEEQPLAILPLGFPRIKNTVICALILPDSASVGPGAMPKFPRQDLNAAVTGGFFTSLFSLQSASLASESGGWFIVFALFSSVVFIAGVINLVACADLWLKLGVSRSTPSSQVTTRAGDHQPVIRSLVQTGFGFPADNPGRAYQAKKIKYLPSLSEVKQLVVFRALTCLLGLELALFAVPGSNYLKTTAIPPFLPFLVAISIGLSVLMIWFFVRQYRRTVSGIESLDAVIHLGESPTINGKPIEKLEFLPQPFPPNPNSEIPVFPHVITAGGRTYHLNLADFEPVTVDTQHEPPLQS